MIKSLIKNIALTIGGAFVVDGIGSYQLFADIPEINAMCICLVAMVVGSIGIFDMFTTIREYFKAK